MTTQRPTSDIYWIREASRLTGIGASCLRMWELRYGWPKPHKHANGYRFFTASQVRQIQEAKTLMDVDGLSISQLIKRATAEKWL